MPNNPKTVSLQEELRQSLSQLPLDILLPLVAEFKPETAAGVRALADQGLDERLVVSMLCDEDTVLSASFQQPPSFAGAQQSSTSGFNFRSPLMHILSAGHEQHVEECSSPISAVACAKCIPEGHQYLAYECDAEATNAKPVSNQDYHASVDTVSTAASQRVADEVPAANVCVSMTSTGGPSVSGGVGSSRNYMGPDNRLPDEERMTRGQQVS
ncbi:hypothetical protein BESB_066090 [Besnoitia besnoiti]|uniref:Uncharacterized protein n=1 Tax=Besnoitia besnoiti TaxID=94643 RepID=A0A2A9MF52_BESBE|nr:hypothetical protein BESB_066090 [Besnoitia besnoiti]PFH34576.1 hypothetical protein BESB_066090 [Besnoitia besnoiti]